MSALLTYHGDPAVKARYVARFDAHRRADEVVQRVGFEGGRGCFIGCTLNGYDADRFPGELGWAIWFAKLAESIFERLPAEEAPAFGSALHEAMPVGVDLERLQFAVTLPALRRCAGGKVADHLAAALVDAPLTTLVTAICIRRTT